MDHHAVGCVAGKWALNASIERVGVSRPNLLGGGVADHFGKAAGVARQEADVRGAGRD